MVLLSTRSNAAEVCSGSDGYSSPPPFQITLQIAVDGGMHQGPGLMVGGEAGKQRRLHRREVTAGQQHRLDTPLQPHLFGPTPCATTAAASTLSRAVQGLLGMPVRGSGWEPAAAPPRAQLGIGQFGCTLPR